METKAEIACTYASLILADDEVEVTADKLNTLLKAANCKFVDGYVTNLFANALSGRNIKEILSSSVSAAAASSAPVAPTSQPSTGVSAAEAAPAAPKEEEKKEESEESDGDMGFDLFG